MIKAASISIPVSEFLERPRRGSIAAAFARSAYLDLDGTIIAAVAPELLNGPLNVVLADTLPPFARLAVGSPVTGWAEEIRVEGGPAISLRGAARWNPHIRPWTPAEMARVTGNLDVLIGRVMVDAPADHLGHPRIERSLAAVRSALLRRSRADLAAAAAGLAGLGGGLTPTGDDVLVGILVAVAGLPDRTTGALTAAIVQGAAGRTSRISDAYLQAAALGQASEAWQRLLASLAGHDPEEIIRAGRRVLAFGETSGADMLTGFLIAMGVLDQEEISDGKDLGPHHARP